jgi:hypothetical protein
MPADATRRIVQYCLGEHLLVPSSSYNRRSAGSTIIVHLEDCHRFG